MDGFPRATAVAIQEAGLTDRLGTLATEGSCSGAKFHSPRPLVLHEIILTDGRRVLLCAVCRDNLRVLKILVDFHEGNLPWRIRREFGNGIRLLAAAYPEGNDDV